MTLIWLCSAFLAGIVVADLLGLPMMPCVVIAGTAALLAALWRKSPAALPLAMLAALALGAARGAAARPTTDATAVWAYVDTTVVLAGTVAQHPDWRDDVQIAIVAAEQLGRGSTAHAVRGLVRLQLAPVPELRYGQRIEATGRLRSPAAEKPSSFRAYLMRHSIYALMERPQVVVVGQGSGFAPLRQVLAVNDHIRQRLQRLLPEPHAGLLAGMLLGTQSAIPRSVQQDFRATGTSHLLVISGWNITVLVGAVVGVFATLGLTRRQAAAVSLPILLAYVFFAGASPAVLRAGVMGALVVWAELADREADTWTSLLLAGAIMALIDPNVLWDVGFQLSAGGTAGLIAWSAPLRKRLTAWLPLEARFLAGPVDILATTLSALILILPVLLYQFGTLPLVSPIANVLLAPAMPLAMLFGILAIAAGLIFLPLGQLLALLAWPFTAWLISGAHFLASVPMASVYVPPFGAWWVWGWYGLVAALAWWHAHRHTILAIT